jgi:hypothetical protein
MQKNNKYFSKNCTNIYIDAIKKYWFTKKQPKINKKIAKKKKIKKI